MKQNNPYIIEYKTTEILKRIKESNLPVRNFNIVSVKPNIYNIPVKTLMDKTLNKI